MEPQDAFCYIIKLISTNNQKTYFWTGENFSENEDEALKKPSGNDFKRDAIYEIARVNFPNCRIFVVNTKIGFAGLSVEFVNGQKEGLFM